MKDHLENDTKTWKVEIDEKKEKIFFKIASFNFVQINFVRKSRSIASAEEGITFSIYNNR